MQKLPNTGSIHDKNKQVCFFVFATIGVVPFTSSTVVKDNQHPSRCIAAVLCVSVLMYPNSNLLLCDTNYFVLEVKARLTERTSLCMVDIRSTL